MNKSLFSLLLALVAFFAAPCLGFAPMHNTGTLTASVTQALNNHAVLQASPLDSMDFVTNSGTSAVDVDALANLVSSSVLLSETEAWVQPLSAVLGPFLNFFSFAMVSRDYMFGSILESVK